MTQGKQRQPTKILIRFLLVVGILVSCVGGWWTCFRTEFTAPGMRVSYETGGPAATITFIVVDAQGNPVSGVTVASESHSGWTPQAVTDVTGRATIQPGEAEVLAVIIEKHVVRFRPEQFEIELLFAPSVSHGLIVTVIMNR